MDMKHSANWGMIPAYLTAIAGAFAYPAAVALALVIAMALFALLTNPLGKPAGIKATGAVSPAQLFQASEDEAVRLELLRLLDNNQRRLDNNELLHKAIEQQYQRRFDAIELLHKAIEQQYQRQLEANEQQHEAIEQQYMQQYMQQLLLRPVTEISR